MTVAAPTPTFPISAPKAGAAKHLKKLHDQIVAADERAAQLEAAHRSAVERVGALKAAVADQARQDAASGADATPEYAELRRQLEQAQHTVDDEPWGARLEGVRAGVNRAHGEYEEHVAANRAALVEQIEQDGERAVQALRVAADALDAALTEHQRVHQALYSVLPRKLRDQGGIIPAPTPSGRHGAPPSASCATRRRSPSFPAGASFMEQSAEDMPQDGLDA